MTLGLTYNLSVCGRYWSTCDGVISAEDVVEASVVSVLPVYCSGYVTVVCSVEAEMDDVFGMAFACGSDVLCASCVSVGGLVEVDVSAVVIGSGVVCAVIVSASSETDGCAV